jgi:GntR family transcriptional regulator
MSCWTALAQPSEHYGAAVVESGLLPIWRQMVERGEALPSEEALAEALGTSRPAIREALIRMEADGLVRRHHGSGTFPNPAALDIPIRLDRATDYADRMAAVGYHVDVELLAADVVELPADTTSRLDVAPGTRVLRTIKRWRADGVVAVVATDLVPLSRKAADQDVVALATRPVLELSGLVGRGRADWMCSWPQAVEVDDVTATMLEYEPGRAVLRMEQVGVERHGQHVFHAVEHHRPGVVDFGLIRTITP